MRYIFTLCLLMLGITIDLVGQSTIMSIENSPTGQTYQLPGNPLEPYWIYEEKAEKIDRLTVILSIQAKDEDLEDFRMDLGYAVTDENDVFWYAYLQDMGSTDWYSVEPHFDSSKGVYRIMFIHPGTGKCFGEMLITATGLTLDFDKGTKHGFSSYLAYSTRKCQPNSVLFSLLGKKWGKP